MTVTLAVAIVFCLAIGLLIWGIGWRSGISAERRLLRVCQGSQDQAERLIRAELSRSPGLSRDEAAARAVQRYERDNR